MKEVRNRVFGKLLFDMSTRVCFKVIGIYVYVCIYKYIHIYVCVCVLVCLRVYIYVSAYKMIETQQLQYVCARWFQCRQYMSTLILCLCLSVCTYIHIHHCARMQLYVCVYVYICVCIIYIYIYTHTDIHRYLYRYRYIHVYIHTYHTPGATCVAQCERTVHAREHNIQQAFSAVHMQASIQKAGQIQACAHT
jgi:hypothetical protein